MSVGLQKMNMNDKNDQEMSPAQIAAEFGIKQPTLYGWLSQWVDEGRLRPIEQPGQEFLKNPRQKFWRRDILALLEERRRAS